MDSPLKSRTNAGCSYTRVNVRLLMEHREKYTQKERLAKGAASLLPQLAYHQHTKWEIGKSVHR